MEIIIYWLYDLKRGMNNYKKKKWVFWGMTLNCIWWWGSSYSVWKFLVLETNTQNHLTMCKEITREYQWQKCWTVAPKYTSLKSNCAIMFTFKLGRDINPFTPQLWNIGHWSSTKMTLALNNPQRFSWLGSMAYQPLSVTECQIHFM